VAHNILKYRSKGGLFTTPESFSKVYGISPEKYDELKPFIRISIIQKQTNPWNGQIQPKPEGILNPLIGRLWG
jgi:hypothetical protein